MKVAFHLDNSRIHEVDLRTPEAGNPGIGGTEFNILCVPYYIQKHAQSDFVPVLYANDVRYLPEDLERRSCIDMPSAVSQACRDGCKIFVFRPRDDDETRGALKELQKTGVIGIAWLHSTVTGLMRELAKNQGVARAVFVGQEQLDYFRDHPIFEKSIVLVNGLDVGPYNPATVRKDDNSVVYVGSLVPSKGFHILAQQWPRISNRNPGAKLYVIGGGNLYDRSSELGDWGLADPQYERRFKKYLSDPIGKPIASVSFLGLMGTEKILWLQRARLGVVNPSGITENCPGSALEFQAAGTPVVSIRRGGLLDTVVDKKTGLLGRTSRSFARNVERLLRNREMAEVLGTAAIRHVSENFSFEIVTKKWEELFRDVVARRPVEVSSISQNPFHRGKILRELHRQIHQIFRPAHPAGSSLAELEIAARERLSHFTIAARTRLRHERKQNSVYGK